MRNQSWPLIVVGVFLILLGIIVTPELLKALGPMRRSLESANELSRRVAELEVLAFRVFSIAVGIIVLGGAIFWRRVCQSHVVTSTMARPVEAAPSFNAATMTTTPFFLLGGGVLGFLMIMGPGTYLFGDAEVTGWSYEDGPVQQLTAMLFLVAGILSFVTAYSEKPGRYRFWALLLGVGFLICAGEEISWGQRIFEFSTPDAISAVNVQNETNIHNLFGYAADHLFIALIFLYGAVLPLLASLFPFVNKLCDRLGLPIASPGLAAGFLLVSLFQSVLVQQIVSLPPDFRVEEVREFLSSIGLLMLMFEAYRRSVHRRSPSAGGHMALQ